MLSRLREHFGTAGLVVAIVALIAALGGGAYAATGGSDGGDATASAKGKQGKQGPRGKTGKTGPQGPAGPAGPAGPQGPAGPKGDTGAPGGNGTNGAKGATGPTGATGDQGEQGEAGEQGEDGEKGEKGDPWSVGGTLPSEATETGTFYIKGEGKQFQTAPVVSLPIPLDPADAELITENSESKIHVVGANGEGTCEGTSQNPTAPPGELCIYKAAGFGIGTFQVVGLAPFNPDAEQYPSVGVSPVGALAYSEENTWSTLSWVTGSFAITAP